MYDYGIDRIQSSEVDLPPLAPIGAVRRVREGIILPIHGFAPIILPQSGRIGGILPNGDVHIGRKNLHLKHLNGTPRSRLQLDVPGIGITIVRTAQGGTRRDLDGGRGGIAGISAVSVAAGLMCVEEDGGAEDGVGPVFFGVVVAVDADCLGVGVPFGRAVGA